MGLGNLLNIANYEPKRRETSSKLLTVTPQQESKKTERLELRLSSDLLLLFKDICEENQTDASKALRAYIEEVISSGTMSGKVSIPNLSVQNVRTIENRPILRESRGFSACGELNHRNKEEREEWLRNYRKWGVWLDVPGVDKKFYRYDLINGCAIVVEVGIEYYDAYSVQRGEPHERISYSIIDAEHKQFNSQGDSFTMVIQWLTKYSKEI